MHHEDAMRRCLELAQKGRGHVGTNPLVGAIIVREEEILAEGYHGTYGGPHAEQDLLKKVDQKMCSDATLYVNLEPCCHRGKTEPCTNLILEHGIATVVYGMQDPNPHVDGKGITTLREAGVEVIGPVLQEQCRRFNRGFVSLHEHGRPWVTLKRAQTRDGRTANDDGSSLKITEKWQDEWAHTHLRTTHDAILIGVQTIVTDNPQLTVRLNKNIDQSFPQPYRVILDPNARIPDDATVCTDEHCDRTILITKSDVPLDGDHFNFDALFTFLLEKHITSVLVEGGAVTWGAFKKAGFFDEEVTLVG